MATGTPADSSLTDARLLDEEGTMRGKGRLAWVDHAKGICIIAVVMMYATHHVQQILHSEGWMQWVVRFAQPFRMPDFFMISGLFVARVIDRPLRRYMDTKVLYFAYFYAVWVSFRFAYTDLPTATDHASLLLAYLQLYVAPPSGPLWFIYILALFFLAVRLARRWHPALVLAVGSAMQIADLHTGITLVDKFSHYFVFFYGGHLFAKHMFDLAERAIGHPQVALLLLPAWALVNAWFVFSGAVRLPGMSLMLGFAGAIAVMLAATLCIRAPWMRWLAWIGRHSIVVYLGFVIPLGVIRMFIARLNGLLDPGTIALLATLASIAGAVLLYLTLRATPLRYLFTRPAWTRIDGAGRPAGSYS